MAKQTEVDAKVFYACLKLQNQAGEATLSLISQYTLFHTSKVSRSLKRLEARGWISRGTGPGTTGWKVYRVNEDEHVSLADTARLVYGLLGYRGANDHVILVDFLKDLRTREKLEYLKEDRDIGKKVNALRKQGYIHNITSDAVRLAEKTLAQRFYLELLAVEVPLDDLATYEFKCKP